MKTARYLLAAFVAFISIASAEPTGSNILPGVRFGMDMSKATETLMNLRSRSTPGTGVLRTHFITTTSMRPGKLAATDKSVPIAYMPIGDGKNLTGLKVISYAQPAAAYDGVKTAWANLQDIAESKFKRVGTPVPMPTVEDFGTDLSQPKEIVTDTWEVSGMKIELFVQAAKAPESEARYAATLRVTQGAK